MTIQLREELKDTDREAIARILRSTGAFFDHEIEVALELVDERLSRGTASGYYFLLAEEEGRVLGYACYGPIACTKHSFDLYWIAVDDESKGRGLGRLLMRAAEEAMARSGGRRVYVETSSRPDYARTRGFYEACAYRVEAVLKEFYGPGDGKVIFVKEVGADA